MVLSFYFVLLFHIYSASTKKISKAKFVPKTTFFCKIVINRPCLGFICEAFPFILTDNYVKFKTMHFKKCCKRKCHYKLTNLLLQNLNKPL
jgi:hypothetical protein